MMLDIGTIVVLGLLPTFAVGQVVVASAKCLSSGYEWVFNSLNESPCDMAASLAQPCYPERVDVFPLPTGYHYTGPYYEYDTLCECNSVFYSVVSACGYCQGREFISWSAYTYNCSRIYHQVYPRVIPIGLQVPPWAYMDVATSNFFNVTRARLMSSGTTSSASIQSSVPSSTLFSSTTLSTASTTTSTTSKNSKKPIGAIVGGIVGGIVLIGGLLGFCLVRKGRKKPTEPIFSPMISPGSSANGFMQQSPFSPAMTINFTGSTSNNMPQRFPTSAEV